MSARTRAMGGVGVATGNDAGALFTNPAALVGLSTMEVQVGGRSSSVGYDQTQRWTPNRRYPDLSLMFENNFAGIKEPDVISVPADALHKPFDSITPAWNNNFSSSRPSTMAAAAPFTFGGMQFAAGIGFAEMINLNHYYQNNNAMVPNLGSYRPNPILALANGETLAVQWFQFIRQREGAVYGVTPAVAIAPIEGFQMGVSVSILTGSSDDNQWRNDRGNVRLMYNTFLLDSANYHVATSGTSKYKGVIPAIGLIFKQEKYSVGISLKPPATITRDWDQVTQIDSGLTHQSVAASGSDKLEMPWLYTVGIALRPTEKWSIGVDYGIQDYANATFDANPGTVVTPWASGKVFRVGVEYSIRQWLRLRTGAREEQQAFAPAGEGLIGEPATGAAYSAGFGLTYGKFVVNAAYEYGTVKYNDMWESNVNTNRISKSTGTLEIGYTFE